MSQVPDAQAPGSEWSVALERTKRNRRVQARYDELMAEENHGHYETMFRVVREEIERVSPPRPEPSEAGEMDEATKQELRDMIAGYKRDCGCLAFPPPRPSPDADIRTVVLEELAGDDMQVTDRDVAVAERIVSRLSSLSARRLCGT